MRRSIVNLLCLFIPSRNARYRIRKKLVQKTRLEKVESAVDMLYFILENCVGVSNIPKAKGELGEIQERNLKLLKFFRDLCVKYDLKYWLDFGTLLGAVRHKGFIPWDDDLDVGIMRNDYEKLMEVLKSDLEGTGYRFCVKREKARKILLKLCSDDGVAQLDVFPYDFYYKGVRSEADKSEFYENLNKGYDEFLSKFGYGIVEGEKKYSSSDVGKIVKEIVNKNNVVLSDKPSVFFGIEFYHAWKNKVFGYDDMFPLKRLEFEGMWFSVPSDFDGHLRLIYGDYMKMPRETHIHEKNE